MFVVQDAGIVLISSRVVKMMKGSCTAWCLMMIAGKSQQMIGLKQMSIARRAALSFWPKAFSGSCITGLLGNVFMWQTHDRQWLPYQYRQHWMKKLCKRAGVEPFGFHGIRHLFASILASKNVPLVEIQKMLRHGSIQTTARYIHSLQKEGSREAIEALPSLKEALG